MYSIDELQVRLVSELREIAEQMGLSNYKKLKKRDLINKILDKQATFPEDQMLKSINSILIKMADEFMHLDKPLMFGHLFLDPNFINNERKYDENFKQLLSKLLKYYDSVEYAKFCVRFFKGISYLHNGGNFEYLLKQSFLHFPKENVIDSGVTYSFDTQMRGERAWDSYLYEVDKDTAQNPNRKLPLYPSIFKG
ncbi:MAG: Rho termination factor N-terminal domain-containing protein [Bacteroidota bacterium]